MEDLAGPLSIFIGIGLFIWGLVSFGIYQDRIACNTFASESNRETKYVRLSFANWSCQTPTKDGKWIDTSLLREI